MQNRILHVLDRPVSVKWSRWILAGCVVVGILIRFLMNRAEPSICRDGVVYIDLATRWIQTGNYPFHPYLPLLPWMMKGLMLCGMSGYAAGVTINIAFGSLLPLVIYGIMRIITGRREYALLAAQTAVFHPMLVELASNILRDIPYLFFTGTAIFFALYAIKSEKWYVWSASSLFLILGIFSRYETLELLPLILLYFLLAPLCRAVSWKRAILGLLVWSISLVIFLTGLIEVMNVEKQMTRAYKVRIERILKKGT